MCRYKRIRNITVFALVLLLFLQLKSFTNAPQSIASAEPIIIDNGDKTMSAIWDFDDPSDYLFYNTTMNNGEVNLTLEKFWWNQTTYNDFNNGSFVSTTSLPSGEVVLSYEMKTIDLIKTGDFSSNQDWTYEGSKHVTSIFNGTAEKAQLGYSYFTGDNVVYLKPAKGEDDGTVTHWTSFGIYTNESTLTYTEIGYNDFPSLISSRTFFYFDISSIPSSAIITNVSFYAKIQDDSSSSNHLIDIHALDMIRANLDDKGLYNDSGNGTLYVDDDDSLRNGVAKVYHEWNLGPQAILDVKANLSRGWFGIGIKEEGNDTERALLSSVESVNPPQLNVSYTTTGAITFNETAYVNQTFYKPNITPNNSSAVNLNFEYSVDNLFNTSANLTVKIDDITVWTLTINSIITNNVNMDVGQYMTESRDYNISLQLHMDVNSSSEVDGIIKYDNVKITTWGYSWLGNYTSQVFDAGSEVLWDEISWNSSQLSETNHAIRTRNSPDGILWNNWSYEYTNSKGEQIIPNKGQKIQFTLNLSTANYTKTPVISDVNISYKKHCWNGTFEMKDDLWVDNIRNWGIFLWEDQTNGQSITYWYSIDKGLTWYQVPLNGNMSSVGIFTNRIRLRANFTTNNPSITPTLLKWNLTYEVSELADLVGWVDPGFGFITSWFNFTLRYSDSENDTPIQLWLNITGGTSHIGSWDLLNFSVDPNDLNYTDGKWYYYNVTGFARGSNYTFHFAALDSSGIWSFSEIYNAPLVLNSPPRILTGNVHGAEEGILYFVDYEAEDLENDTLTWSLKRNATWLNLNSITGNLSGTPPTGIRGSYWVNVTVIDGHGGVDWTNFTMVVGDTIPPIADAGKDGMVYEDEPYNFDGTNSTDNSGVLNYTWYFGDGTIGYGPKPEHIYIQNGIYLVALIARDPLNNEDVALINITVLNKPPLADAGDDRIVNEGEIVNFDGSKSYDTFSDNATLVFLWDFDNDTAYDDGVGPTPSYVWYDNLTTTVGLMVMDIDGDFNISEIIVTVLNVDPIVDIGDYYTGSASSEIIMIASFYDPGEDDLEFRWDWENDGFYDTVWSNDFIVRHSWGNEGNYTVKIEVRDDDGGLGTDTAKVNITKRKVPPVISNLGSRKIRYKDAFTIDLASYITDEDTPLSELVVTTSDPGNVSVGGLKITLYYPEEAVGETVSLEVFVSDGTFIDSEFLTVDITVNYPPTLIEPIPDVQFLEDETLEDAFNLNDYFEDQDGEKLEFEPVYTEPNLFVIIYGDGQVDFRTSPNWAGNATVRFIAKDPSGAFDEDEILVSVIPINDPPIVLKQIGSTNIRENENWSVDLLEYFLDVDDPQLIYTCNRPEIKIDQFNHTAIWVPGNKKELKGVVFTASDGEHSLSLEPFDLRVLEPEPFPWLYIILATIFALILGALVFAAYREIRYRYNIEEVFLVDNAGVLLVHLSRGESKAIDAKLVSGMLTAVQEFVRDSFRGNDESGDMEFDEGALGKLEYGDFQIVIERGEYTFLSAVISGYDNKRLRKRMKDVVVEFETKYSSVLADWDGDMARFEGAEKIVGRLLKGPSSVEAASDEKTGGVETSEYGDFKEDNADELPHGDFGDVPSYYDEVDK